ncbi:TrmH family RNA methyltransferase [Acidobacteriota bacterium]
MPTKERIERIKTVLSHRKSDLRVVLEDVKNAHNASAVVRTCDAVGVQYIDIISNEQTPFPVNDAISTKVEKWLEFNYHTSTKECLWSLKEQGFMIVATSLGEKTEHYTKPDYRQPAAFIFGNEKEGISDDARARADYCIQIPMLGMAQSLNLSVSVAVILFEALRQREADSAYQSVPLSKEEIDQFLAKWLE